MTSSYLVLKTVHVLAVVIWVGGTVTFAAMARVFSRDAAGMRMLGTAGIAAGRYLLMPGSIVALITGLIMMIQVGGHPPLWMLYGLIAGPGSGVIGGMFIRRTAMALGEALSRPDGAGRVDALRSRLTLLTIVNVTLLLSAVAVMVVKPNV